MENEKARIIATAIISSDEIMRVDFQDLIEAGLDPYTEKFCFWLRDNKLRICYFSHKRRYVNIRHAPECYRT